MENVHLDTKSQRELIYKELSIVFLAYKYWKSLLILQKLCMEMLYFYESPCERCFFFFSYVTYYVQLKNIKDLKNV